MAVLSTIPGIRVTVTSGGSALREYADDDNEFIHSTLQVPKDRVSTVYIECVDNAFFEILFEILPGCKLLDERHNALIFWAEVDGKSIGGTSARRFDVGWSSVFKTAVSRANDHQIAHQTLKFGTILKLDDVDAERFEKDRKAAKGVGEILVYVQRSKELDTPRDGHFHQQPPLASITDLSEKALKGQAISHAVTFGKEVLKTHAIHNKRIYPDGERTALAVFRFKYRSRKALQLELIIPRTPSPAPEAQAIQAQDGSERIARLKREINKIKTESRYKREAPADNEHNNNEDDDDDVQIVSSTATKRLKISQNASGVEIIDLIDD